MLLSINPVNSVFFLIFIFFACSILFIILDGDFIGMIILVVYVGAIAVLFLFIVMIINIKRIEKDNSTYLILGLFFVLILIVNIYYLILSFFFDSFFFSVDTDRYYFLNFNYLDESNKKYILIFISYFIFFKYPIFILFSGFILVIGIISSIYLTNFKSGFSFRKQYNQLSRRNILVYLHIY